jgi:hypothetical protein
MKQSKSGIPSCKLPRQIKWSRQMTKFISDKQEHQTKQKQEGKQKLIS